MGRESHKFQGAEKDWSGKINRVELDKGKQEEVDPGEEGKGKRV